MLLSDFPAFLFTLGCHYSHANANVGVEEVKCLLCVQQVWSSGRVGYIPMYFIVEEQIGSFHFQNSSLNGLGNRQLYTADIM